MMSFVFKGAKSITTFEILPQPPPSRGNDNPWPTFPRVFKVDYGHEEVKVKFGKDPRAYSTLTKVRVLFSCSQNNNEVVQISKPYLINYAFP